MVFLMMVCYYSAIDDTGSTSVMNISLMNYIASYLVDM